MEKIILRHQRALGDIVVMTALARDLEKSYPGRFHINVDTTFRDVWLNNPYVKPMPDKKNARIVNLTYGAYIKKAATEHTHFISSFHKDFEKQTNIKVSLLQPHPDLHLNEEEQESLIEGRYWVIVAGGKNDFTTKHWIYDRCQKVVDSLRPFGIKFVQVGGKGSHPTHAHPKLNNVLDMVGKTDIRQMMRLINSADGVICTITSAMHIAAAFGKPCVVTGAGREEWWWEAYHQRNPALVPVQNLLPVSHRYLHTIGKLDCCAKKGCWKNKVQRAEGDRSFCSYPVQAEKGQMVPLCMDMITVEKVVGSVLSYYLDGTLPLLEGMVLPDVTQPITFKQGEERFSLFVLREGGEPTMSEQMLDMPINETPYAVTELSLAVNKKETIDTGPPKLVTPELASPRTNLMVDAFNGPVVRQSAGTRLVDSPHIGGKITMFVLLYGNFPDMHRRCLTAIQNTTTRDSVELRVYCNNVCLDTQELCKKLFNDGVVSVIYSSDKNKFKYPCMREMFHDEKFPIKTKWVLWFDDDTMCDTDPLWFDKLCSVINSTSIADSNFGMLGPIYHYALQDRHANWIKQGKWYKGRQFRDKSGKESVNANKIFFVTGSFWALKTEALKKADVPDERLSHNGGDICIGEQVWQNGYNLKSWNGDKKIVCWSSTARRGANQPIFNI
jgi:ADP-heptose:LPS heptosyltransferase/GT2 family glycosyltransferase